MEAVAAKGHNDSGRAFGPADVTTEAAKTLAKVATALARLRAHTTSTATKPPMLLYLLIRRPSGSPCVRCREYAYRHQRVSGCRQSGERRYARRLPARSADPQSRSSPLLYPRKRTFAVYLCWGRSRWRQGQRTIFMLGLKSRALSFFFWHPCVKQKPQKNPTQQLFRANGPLLVVGVQFCREVTGRKQQYRQRKMFRPMLWRWRLRPHCASIVTS